MPRRLKWPEFRFGPVNLHTVLDAFTFYRLRSAVVRPHEHRDHRQPGCRAVQYSDQMHCPDCDLTWDMNDPEPPPCAR